MSTNKTLRSLVGDLPDGSYFLTANTTGKTEIIFLLRVGEPWHFNRARSLTSADLDSIVIFYASGANTEAVVSEIQIEPGNQATPYTPYNPASKTITIPFGQTIYGGTLDVVTGMLTVTQAEIASYNGEDLPGGWISDRDTYGPGAAPTIGAQVVYELAEPQIIQLTPQEILALSGVNTIYADTGDVTVAGRADPNAVIKQLAARIAALESAAVANA